MVSDAIANPFEYALTNFLQGQLPSPFSPRLPPHAFNQHRLHPLVPRRQSLQRTHLPPPPLGREPNLGHDTRRISRRVRAADKGEFDRGEQEG